MIIKWNKKLKDKFGWSTCKDLHLKDKKCLDRPCFHPHDWNHDGRLVCLRNANFGCPRDYCHIYDENHNLIHKPIDE